MDNDNRPVESLEPENLCTVSLNGEITSSDDFVAILASPDGDVQFLYDTDAMTMGQAAKLCALHFVTIWEDITGPERREIMELLGEHFEKGVFILNG